MKNLPIYLIIFILSISLALAVNVETDQTGYTGDEIVSITVSDCEGVSILKILNPTSMLIDIKSGQDNWVADYNTLSDSADGKYKAVVTCTNGMAETEFCVDEDTCLGVVPPPSPPSSGGSGGGGGCSTKWSCSTWTFCNSELIQTRTCTDKNGCEKPKTETRECLQCLESWVCSVWADCYLGNNERNCYDEHKCGTSTLKPYLTKSCSLFDASGPPPARISTQLPPPYVAPQVIEESSFQNFWNDYGMYLLLGLGVLILLIVIIVLTLHYLKSRKMAYNINELKQWVKKEKAMGTSVEDIREILEDHTGWKKKEIDLVMKDVNKPLSTTSKPMFKGMVKKPIVKGMAKKPMFKGMAKKPVNKTTKFVSKLKKPAKKPLK